MFISIGIDENGKPFVATSDKSEKPSRPNKGHSLIAAPDTYTVIDIETTGLDSVIVKSSNYPHCATQTVL